MGGNQRVRKVANHADKFNVLDSARPPTLYVSPGRPSERTRSIARQWSATNSQSRTLRPSP